MSKIDKANEMSLISAIIGIQFSEELMKQGSLLYAIDKVNLTAEKFFSQYGHITNWEEWIDSKENNTGAMDWADLVTIFAEKELFKHN